MPRLATGSIPEKDTHFCGHREYEGKRGWRRSGAGKLSLAVRQTEEEPQPSFQILECDCFARRVEVGLHIGGEAVAREHHQTGNRPRRNVLDDGRDLLFGAAPNDL